jgi:hypothetical protein
MAHRKSPGLSGLTAKIIFVILFSVDDDHHSECRAAAKPAAQAGVAAARLL